MIGEDRLRQLMQDPAWALPAWPDAHARVRRTARRQRIATASAGTAVAATIAVAALVPAILLGTASAPMASGHKPGAARTAPPAATSTSPAPSASPVTPPVGSAQFPAQIYPAAVKSRLLTRDIALCPDPAGLEAPGPATPAAALMVLHQLGRALYKDLRVSDRSAWPFLASALKTGEIQFLSTAWALVRFAGPLQNSPGLPASVRRAVVAGCGSRVARATWVIIDGPARKLASDSIILFVTRRGHMLFYRLV